MERFTGSTDREHRMSRVVGRSLVENSLRILPFCLCLALGSVARAQWTETHLFEPRSELAAAGWGGVAYFGGGIMSYVLTDTVDIYNAATDTWSTTTLSPPRYQLAAGAIDGKIVFAGGAGSSGGAPSQWVDVFDVATGAWSQSMLPFPATRMAVTAVDGKVFFGGGETLPAVGWLSVVQIYDTATGQWSVHDFGAGPRLWMAAASDERYAFFAGGSGNSTKRRLEIYDSQMGTWSVRQMPHEHAGASAITVDGRLYIGGGTPGSEVVDVLDLTDWTWTSLALPHYRSTTMAGAAGPFVIFAGGAYYDYSRNITVHHDTADVLNILTGEWITMKLSTSGIWRSIVSLPDHDKVLIAGGADWPTVDPLDNVDIFHLIDPLGTTYCSPANPNSTGQPGSLRALGAEMARDNFVTLEARDLPADEFGYFLVGSSMDFVANPGGSQGNLCLGGSIGRYDQKVLSSGPEGSFAISVDLRSLPTSPRHDVQPGETWSFQAWYRDKAPQATSNFTDAVSITFQ